MTAYVFNNDFLKRIFLFCVEEKSSRSKIIFKRSRKIEKENIWTGNNLSLLPCIVGHHSFYWVEIIILF